MIISDGDEPRVLEDEASAAPRANGMSIWPRWACPYLLWFPWPAACCAHLRGWTRVNGHRFPGGIDEQTDRAITCHFECRHAGGANHSNEFCSPVLGSPLGNRVYGPAGYDSRHVQQ